jgi:hypothetical protein
MSTPCPFGDPYCPCQDGDPCHYVAADGLHAMEPPPVADYDLTGITLDCSGFAVTVRRRLQSGRYQLADLRAWAWLCRMRHYVTRMPT